ncbi:MAG: hypothetical protein CR997_12130 [Acidobacteria bacterium]|nr:MAG: hypothetical protein CR997_12130 [Acidobacteriota bacterium]
MKTIVKLLIPIAFLLVGIFCAVVLMAKAPKPATQPKEAAPQLVETLELAPVRKQVVVEAYGTVIPATKISLRAQVSGQVVDQNLRLIPGGLLQKGEFIVQIQSEDYLLAIKQQEEAVATARQALAVEEGQGIIAKEEWSLLETSIETSETGKNLALRIPQLERAKAALVAAESRLDKAKLDLERTRVTAPFNAVVQAENVDVGQVLNASSEIATLVGTDSFWVQASIAYDKLSWVQLPDANGQNGSPAEVTLGDSTYPGRMIQLLSDLDPVGRMARLLIEIKDPLSLDESNHSIPLLLGSYVNIKLFGSSLGSVFEVPYQAVHIQGDVDPQKATVWVVDEESRLVQREVDVIWQDNQGVYLSRGVQAGDKIVTSNIQNPLSGMKVRDTQQNKQQSATSELQPEPANPPKGDRS